MWTLTRAAFLGWAQGLGRHPRSRCPARRASSANAPPNDLFFVGDARPRIYGRPVVLAQCGISVRGRACKLRLNYRTIAEIRG